MDKTKLSTPALLTSQQADQIALDVSRVFTPRTPVADRELFAGRTHQLTKVFDALDQVGLHAILYGERGVGKTSLANIIPSIPSSARILTCKVNCEAGDTFESVWKKALGEFKYSVRRRGVGFTAAEQEEIKRLSDSVGQQLDANSIRLLFSAAGARFLIIFDEFDRLPPKTSASS